jgi:uncharacterized protein (DUF433 family)
MPDWIRANFRRAALIGADGRSARAAATSAGKCYPRLVAFDRITSHPDRLGGQPCIRELRISVRRVLEALRTYPDRAELFREYPDLEEEDIQQVLAYAEALLDDRVVPLSKTG